MQKRHELATPTSCLSKAAADEPIFVLRANDPLAVQTIRLWAAMASAYHEESKIHDAYGVAEEMDIWRNSRLACPEDSHTCSGIAGQARGR